jgi:hypothetical protein
MEEEGDNLGEEEVGAGSRMGMEARMAGGEEYMMVGRTDRTSDNQYQDREPCDKHLLISSGIMGTHKMKVEVEDLLKDIPDDKHFRNKFLTRSRSGRTALLTAKLMAMDYRTDPSSPSRCTD